MDVIRENASVITVALIAINIILLGLMIHVYSEAKRVRSQYKAFMLGTEAKNLETLLLESAERIANLENDRNRQDKSIRGLEKKLKTTVGRVGLVRFNAFPDAGGELSFSLALLDDESNGILVSSIYGRAEARVYAKHISRGRAATNLSVEEQGALDQAANIK
ncbi:MAG: DUF4446 family protein [bacterium]|nr:DUF4446 family protein [bacterium]